MPGLHRHNTQRTVTPNVLRRIACRSVLSALLLLCAGNGLWGTAQGQDAQVAKPLPGAAHGVPAPPARDASMGFPALPTCRPLGHGLADGTDPQATAPAALAAPGIPAMQAIDIDRDLALRVATARAVWEWGPGVRLGSIVPIQDAAGSVYTWDVDFTTDGAAWDNYENVASDWQSFCSARALAAEARMKRGESATPREWSSKRYASVTVSATFDAPPIRGSRPGVSSFYATGWIAAEVARQALGTAEPALQRIIFTGTWERLFEFSAGGRTIFVQGHEPWAWFDRDEYLAVAREAEQLRWQRVRARADQRGRTVEAVRDSVRAAHAGYLATWLGEGFGDRSPSYILGYDSYFIPYRWFGGCSPTSAGMVLNYYDEIDWYGRITYDYTTKADPVNGSTKCHVSDAIVYLRSIMHTDSQGYTNSDSIYPGMVIYANDYCGYSFSGGINVLIFTGNWHFDDARAEIDGDHPFTWSGNYYPGTGGDGHTVAVVGYDTAPDPDEYLCYNTWAEGGTPEAAPHSGGLLDGGELVAPHPGGSVPHDVKLTWPDGDQTYNSCNSSTGIRAGEVYDITWNNFGRPAHHVDIQYSPDGGDTWNWLASGAADNGSYTWAIPCDTTSYGRVRILQYNSSGGLLSADGSYGPFDIDYAMPPMPPMQQSPSNGATCQGVAGVLDWSDTGATAYQVELGTTCGSGSVYTVTASQYSYSGLSPSMTYYWRVRGQTLCGVWGYWGPCHAFSTGPTPLSPPGLSSPANGAVCVAADGDLDWADVPGASGYRVQLGWTCGGTSPYVDVTTSSFHFTGLDPGRTYYWRVKTKDACGTYGEYSGCWHFTRSGETLAAPALLSPPDGSLIEQTSGTLDWSDVGGAAGYRVRIGTSCGSGTVYTIDSPTSQCAYSGLANQTIYYWQVATKDNCGQWGGYSACFYFRTRDPATFTVRPDGGGTYPTIQAAINMALNGDIIELTDGTFTGTGNRDLVWNSKTITIRSQSGNPQACVIDCQGTESDMRRGFTFYSLTTSALLDGIGITHGYQTYGGALYFDNGCTGPTINNCRFNLNYSTTAGGAIWCGSATAPTFTSCDIYGNVSFGNGGGINCSGSTPTLNACQIRLNNATLGGGMYAWYATPVLTGTSFQGNSANDGGGGLYATHSSPHPTDCLFLGNTATNSGGAVKCADVANPAFTRCTFSENGAPAGGTLALYMSSNITMDHTIVSFAIEGGSVSCDGTSHATLSCCDVYGNTGGDWIGCIASQSGSNGNFSADPLYCNSALANFALHLDSPCAAENNPTCGRVGALGIGCGPSQPVEVWVSPDGSGTYPTIQAALSDIPSGSTIILTDGIFRGAGNRDLAFNGKSITLRSQSGDPPACVIDCQGSAADPHRGFELDFGEGPGCVIEGLTVRNGFAADKGGGVLTNTTSPVFRNCIFESCVAGAWGGAVYGFYNAHPTFEDCIFRNNASTSYGGAVDFWTGCSPAFSGCAFENNISADGGAVDIYDASHPTFTECTFDGNGATLGGAVYCDTGCQPVFSSCTFHGNEAPLSSRRTLPPRSPQAEADRVRRPPDGRSPGTGGAIFSTWSSTVQIENTIIAFGTAGEACACASGGTVAVSCSDIFGNLGGDWENCIADQAGQNGNLCADPQFCDAEAGSFLLLADSPCAEENNPTCGGIGAQPVGCGYHILVEAGGGGNYPTIQAAIDAAGERDIVELGDGTYTGTGNRDLDYHGKAITVRSGSGNPAACIIDCQGAAGNAHRGFNFHSGEDLTSTLEGVTVTGGYGSYGAGLMISSSSATIKDCILRNNHATDTGGAMHIYLGGALVQDCLIEDNQADNAAGGISNQGATPTVDGCIFRGNWAHWGGGGMCNYNASPTLTECVFEGNSSDNWGGGLHNSQAGSQPLLIHCTFYGNAAPYGGGIYNRVNAQLTAENTIIAFGSVGAAVYCVAPSSATLTCCDVYGNAGGDWTGCLAGQEGMNGNLSADPFFCDPTVHDFSLHDDSPCAAENNETCGVVGALGSGCGATDVAMDEVMPSVLSLGPGIPNPFREGTLLTLAIPEDQVSTPVAVHIYDASGRLVRTLIDGTRPAAGVHRLAWNGTDDSGSPLRSGIYFVEMRTPGASFTRRIVCIR
jgi:predicted outer membrane repeat protein